jgi:hypothetical protein
MPVAVKHSSAVEVRVRRLLGMLAALEEAIIRIEGRGDPEVERVVERLRALQADIAIALRLDDARAERRRSLRR